MRRAIWMPGPELGIPTPVQNVNAPCWLYTHLYGWIEICIVNYFPPGISGDPEGLDERYELVFAEPVQDGEESVTGAVFVPGEDVLVRR